MRKTLIALLALAATPALAAPDKPSPRSTAHLEHLGHGGLGKRLSAAEVRRLPKAYAAIERSPKAATSTASRKARASDRTLAERAGYKAVTELTNGAFPPFYPSLGAVYVRPKTLPVGPFLTFDRKGHQVSTVYMLSLEEMNGHKKFDATGTRSHRVDHVTVYYHGGHPGVDFPHYHNVLWHVSQKGEQRVAK
jgi:hypothetical protein